MTMNLNSLIQSSSTVISHSMNLDRKLIKPKKFVLKKREQSKEFSTGAVRLMFQRNQSGDN